MNIQDVFYHGVRHQVKRVLSKMSDSEIEAGLTAFENGASTWSACFFARALAPSGVNLDAGGNPESKIMLHLGLDSLIPIRMVWCTFDGAGVSMTKEQLRSFIMACRTSDEGISDEVLAVLKGINYEGAGEKPLEMCAVTLPVPKDWTPDDPWGESLADSALEDDAL